MLHQNRIFRKQYKSLNTSIQAIKILAFIIKDMRCSMQNMQRDAMLSLISNPDFKHAEEKHHN